VGSFLFKPADGWFFVSARNEAAGSAGVCAPQQESHPLGLTTSGWTPHRDLIVLFGAT
jgi:hypothetical protein